jgi:hypothetical protein
MSFFWRKFEIVFTLSWTVCASVGSANNINKLSLVGMQLPEKYKDNFDVSSEDSSSTPDEG